MTQSVRAVWQYRGLIGNFARRELKGKYKGSVLGSVWSLINPLATLAIYSLVFGFFLRFPPPVAGNGELQSFPIYLFTGLVVWNFFLRRSPRRHGRAGRRRARCCARSTSRRSRRSSATPLAVLQADRDRARPAARRFAVGNVGWTVLLLPLLLVLLAAFTLGSGCSWRCSTPASATSTTS